MHKQKFLDTTLRDGSYAINFQFSVSDLERICRNLEKMGYEYIEIGHGVGLNGSSEKNGIALHSDEEYLEMAAATLKKSKYGMFCIPDTARLEDLSLANKYHMNFVRIGTNVNETELSETYIKYAKDLGMMVMSNFMKSYTVSTDEFARQVELAQSYGTDMIYIVDSAGCMFQEDIKKYYDAIKKVSDLPVGFHAHNNLGMAVANSIYAYELGIDFIDTTLQGLGRSAGNAASELVIAALIKRGHNLNFDLNTVLTVSKALIQPLVRKRGLNPLDIICGFSEFHSSYMKDIHRISTKYDVNPLELIMLYCEENKISLDAKEVEVIAKKLPKTTVASIDFDFWEYF